MTPRMWVRNTQMKLNKFNSRWVSANLLVVGELVSVWVTGRIELKLFLMLNSVHHADIWRCEVIAPPILNIGIRCSWLVSFKLLWFHPKGNNIGTPLNRKLVGPSTWWREKCCPTGNRTLVGGKDSLISKRLDKFTYRYHKHSIFQRNLW